MNKINWISNCVKHNDGFPTKKPKPAEFVDADESQRIKIGPQEFRGDCDLLIQLYPIYLQLMFLFAQHKLLTEKPLLKEDYEFAQGTFEQYVEKVNDIDTKFSTLVASITVL